MSGARSKEADVGRTAREKETRTMDPPTFCPTPLSASDVFLQGMTGEINTGDILRMVETQNQMYVCQIFRVSNVKTKIRICLVKE